MKKPPRKRPRRRTEPRKPNQTTYHTILRAILNMQMRLERLERGHRQATIGFGCSDVDVQAYNYAEEYRDMDEIAEEGPIG